MDKLRIRINISDIKVNKDFRIDLSEYDIDCILSVYLFNYLDLPVKTFEYLPPGLCKFNYDVDRKLLDIFFITLDWLVENIKYITIDLYSKVDQRNLRIENLLK